jgi:hypothetical protein
LVNKPVESSSCENITGSLSRYSHVKFLNKTTGPFSVSTVSTIAEIFLCEKPVKDKKKKIEKAIIGLIIRYIKTADNRNLKKKKLL